MIKSEWYSHFRTEKRLSEYLKLRSSKSRDTTARPILQFILNHVILIAILLLLLLRLVVNFSLPLMDKTEARYAEISRLMLETGDWVSPHIDYNVVFWAKPPLSIWSSSISMYLFGINEFAARLPSIMYSMAIILMLGLFMKGLRPLFFLPGLILMLMPEFFLHAGVVSTDMSLVFSTTLVMTSFWMLISRDKRMFWGPVFFIGLALGLLAKGPIALILTLPPIAVWCLHMKSLKVQLKKMPWFTGLSLFFIISIPWYFFAELKTPGFINYFIVGEHFKRFIDSSWNGDLYGFPKSQPYGIIWIFLIIFTLPWIPVVFLQLKRRLKVASLSPISR